MSPEPPPELAGLNSFLGTPDYFLFIPADYSAIRYESHNTFKGLVFSRIGIKCEEPAHLLKDLPVHQAKYNRNNSYE